MKRRTYRIPGIARLREVFRDNARKARKVLIQEYVRKGAQIEAIEGSLTLCLPDGAFYRAGVFTATGLAYARFLISRR